MADRSKLERRTRGMVRIGGAARKLLRRAVAAQEGDARRINAIFDDVDIVLTPTLTAPPLAVGKYDGCGAARTFNGAAGFVAYNPLWNHIGNPAAAVPAGMDSAGLPLSVQIAGRPDSEPLLLSLAAQIEAARPWADARPPVS